jgi:hypothetical protein
MGLNRVRSKNDCAGEDQQQFTGLDWKQVSVESAVGECSSWAVSEQFMVGHEEPLWLAPVT